MKQVFKFLEDCLWYDSPICKEFHEYVAAFMGSSASRTKADIQAGLDKGTIRVLIATCAWGMGMDQRDIRLVVIYSIPKTLAELAQQMGRGGRDGADSCCVIHWTSSDLVGADRDLIMFIKGNGNAVCCRRMLLLCALEGETEAQINRRMRLEKTDLGCAGSSTQCDWCHKRAQEHGLISEQTPTPNNVTMSPITVLSFPTL